ncbi:MAG: putative protein-S-isoprenylcysteine methyltransferase [Candidatus Ozemobacter sibiricus]|jgi:protein-S-isoprenylcysteine O-methyltransferase Ste14|uniref:Uncharacterized protein n=1 Tax=Candidatus Ozemobacter sibiricus TaxID=2268124 RepID=A0A367ZSW0_9BACT|nr:MAG: putative protein-S-isoprenylcysteine methyltransferase [Candidatus Ozemobacter sibiricus]
MNEFIHRYWQTAVNFVLVFVFLDYGFGMNRWLITTFGGPDFLWLADYFPRRPHLGVGAAADFVEVAFFLHNLVFLGVILFRQDHRAIETRAGPQLVALFAFFSGMWFVQTPATSPALLLASDLVTLVALVFGMGCLVNLGRSFGILIAARTIKTTGLYGMIRHPMYLSDIVWRIAYLLKNPCPRNLVLFVISSLCYVARAIMEENFLSQFPEYREYKERVRYRFVPGVF